jgi:hypothetical protein
LDCLTLYLQALPSADTSAFRLRLKCDGTRAETRFRLSAKRTSPFKSAGERQFSRLLAAEVCAISGSNAGYIMFRGSVKSTGYPLHSPVSPSIPPLASPCAITFQLDSITYQNKSIFVSAAERTPNLVPIDVFRPVSCQLLLAQKLHLPFPAPSSTSAADFCNSLSSHHMYFNSVDSHRITKSMWIWK